MLERLEEFRGVRGHLYVPTDFVCDDGFALGRWVEERRRQARNGELPARYVVLNKVPGWDWEPCHPRLLAGFGRLRDYVSEYGTSRVPLWYVCDDGFRLGVWVRSRRARPSSCAWLNEALEELPFWRVSRKGVPPQWRSDRVIDEAVLRHLEEFRAQHGRVQMAREAALAGRLRGDRRLSDWLGEQKRAARSGRLDREQVELLRQAGLIDVHLHRR